MCIPFLPTSPILLVQVKVIKILKDLAAIPFVPGTTRFTQILAGWCALLMLSVSTASAYNVVPKMAWWYDARFGMFIHFGSYSYYGNGEWEFSNNHWTKANYQTQISAHSYPSNFNAATIVGFAKAAGMKYIVITAKHHEGFAMWHSQVASFTDVPGTTLYNLYNYAGFHRDLLMELKNECDAQGIKFCLYYSILDWNHPSQNIANFSGTVFSTMTSMQARTNYINDMKAQLGELITNYNPAVLWFDGDWYPYTDGPPTVNTWWNKSDGTNLYNYLIGLKPDLIINERVKRSYGLGDFDCPEQTVPTAPLARPWETCATMNGQWGYTSWAESSYRSASNILYEMVQVLSRDGNYLLNIGPKGDGTMTPGSTNILGTFATWMNTNSESVHGTTASPYGTNEPSWGYYTKKPGKLYAHVFNWPGGGQLLVPVLSNTVNRVYLLSDTNHSLSYTISGGNINISVPAGAPSAMDSVVVVAVSPPPLAASKAASPNQVILSWPAWATNRAMTGYAVYGATNLVPPVQWQVVTNMPQTSNGIFNLALPTSGKQQFFMLAPP
jgi:alpha-L-fucosidase